MAGRLGGRAGLPRARPRARGRQGALLHARDAAVPVRAAAHGTRPQLHDGRRRHTLPPAHRPRGAAPDGLRLVRPAGRERRDPRGRSPARDHRAQHRDDHEPDAPHGLGHRLAARRVGARDDVLPLDAVALPQVPGEGARVPEGSAGQLVPERPDRARERARRRREVLALRRRRRGAEHGAVVLQDHRVRRPAARRPGDDRLARAHEEDPDELDRALGRGGGAVPRRRARHRHPRLHDASRHAVRRDVLRRRARVAARRQAGRGNGAGGRSALVRAHRGGAADRGARAAGEDRRVHRALRDEPRERRAHPDLGRRLRADGVRHRRDHGGAGARRARCRVRRRVRAAGRRRDLGGRDARQLR